MGTTIDAVAVVRGRRWHGRSARHLAISAARACLARGGAGPGDVDLLINAGLYHERNLGEPALAALIQEDLGANPEDPHAGAHGTFSFDVANGACGVLTALQVADGFLAAGTIRHALVVASDTDPGHRLANGFPFAPAGAALLCRWHDGPAGLAGFRFATDRSLAAAFSGVVAFDHGRNRLRIEHRAGFEREAATTAAAVAGDLLDEAGVSPAGVDLVVANPLERSFLEGLASRLGVAEDRLVTVEDGRRTHTAGLAVALDAARHQGRMTGGRTILLVSAGAGLTAGAALLCAK